MLARLGTELRFVLVPRLTVEVFRLGLRGVGKVIETAISSVVTASFTKILTPVPGMDCISRLSNNLSNPVPFAAKVTSVIGLKSDAAPALEANALKAWPRKLLVLEIKL